MLNPSRRVVLFLPPYSGKVLGPPLGLLSLAASLRKAQFQPVIIDGALKGDWRLRIAEETKDCAAFGVSLLTGPMIREAMEAAKFVRARQPEVPIVFGGWHPSLMTAQTLREDFVDIVVRHQGEQTLVEILDRLACGRELDLVAGCWFKRDGRIQENPDRPAAALGSLPAPAYDLVDFDAYARAGGVRKLPYATSTGCPYACNYCTDMIFYNRRFNPYDAERVVDEVTGLVRRYRLEEVALVDSNFLVDIHRARALAEGFVKCGVKFRWSFQASTDLLCRMSDEDVRLLAASGVYHIGFGTESASPEVLLSMNKRHQEIPDIYEAARKCSEAGIRVTLNLIFGFPGEEERHRRETLRVMAEVGSKYDSVFFSPNLFTAYPGIPVWPQLKELGLREPESLAEWAEMDLGGTRLPWLRGRALARLETAIRYFQLENQLKKVRRKSGSALLRAAAELIRTPLRWRLERSYFGVPLELWISFAKEWLVIRRSLLTGQPLAHELTKAK